MKPIRRILLILDPSLSSTPAMERAEALAQALGAQLWLGLFDPGPRLGFWGVLHRDEAHRIESRMRDQEAARLRDLRHRFKERTELTVRTIDARERPTGSSIAEAVIGHEIDLVIKDVGHESTLRRLFFAPLDWEILRSSPVPVWLVGGKAAGLPERVAVAVDPVHPEHGAGALNDAILETAKLLASTRQAQLRVFSVFEGLPSALMAFDPNGLGVGLSAGLGFDQEDLYERLRVDHHRALHALAEKHGLPADATELLFGQATESLLEALDRFHPEVLVVGTLRRQGLDRLFMGSTAERLVNRSPCEVLAVPAAAARPTTGASV